MSKIGKINISIPEKVKVALTGNVINIEGPLGKKSLIIEWGKGSLLTIIFFSKFDIISLSVVMLKIEKIHFINIF